MTLKNRLYPTMLKFPLALLAKPAKSIQFKGKKLRPISEIPSPKDWPFLGNFWKFRHPDPAIGTKRQQSLKIASHFRDLYGPLLRFNMPCVDPMLFVFCPDMAETIYRAAGTKPERPGLYALDYIRSKDPFFKDFRGLLTTQGEEWHRNRLKVHKPLLRPQNSLAYTQVLEDIATDFIENRILPIIEPDSNQVPPNFLEEVYKWGLESVGYIALNTRLGCVEQDVSEDSESVKIINAVSTIFRNTTALDDTIHYWKFLPSKTFKEYETACGVFKAAVLKHINFALGEIKAQKETGTENEHPSVLEQLTRSGCDEATAVTMALDMIFAGIDTTGHTVVFLLYHLARNPEVQESLFAELQAHKLSRPSDRIDDKIIDKLTFLKATFKESTRITPTAPANARKLFEDIELNGYLIPKGTMAVIFHYHILNDPANFPNPTEFIPSRWIKGQRKNFGTPIHPFAHLPFGHGTRMCVGRRFAETEIFVLAIKILQRFKLEWHHHEIGLLSQTLIGPDRPMQITFVERK